MSVTTPTDPRFANDLLDGFDVCDAETKEFLASLIVSGQAPPAEVDELQQLSLMRGVDEWDMLFECATVLQERNISSKSDSGGYAEESLVPFLQAIRGTQAGAEEASLFPKNGIAEKRPTRRKPPGKVASHFWAEGKGSKKKRGRRGKLQDDNLLRVKGHDPPFLALTSQTPIEADDALELEEGRTASPRFGSSVTSTPAQELKVKGYSLYNSTKRLETALVAVPNSPTQPNAVTTTAKAVKSTGGSTSPFFVAATPPRRKTLNDVPTPPSTTKRSRPPRGTVSGLPIPPLSTNRFGLIQEELADNPFRLLVAVTFLIRTSGRAAIPIFWQLMECFPTPDALATADPAEITALIRPLGLSIVRCAAIQKYARMWLERRPCSDVRYVVKNYPNPGDGRHVSAGEMFGPEDVTKSHGVQHTDAVSDARERAVGCAWEIGHLTQGPYALDSWRIFCRDVLLGRSDRWTGNENAPGFQPEWMRVLPKDKELRACLRWMWMREGWEWNPLNGDKKPLREDLRKAVDDGQVGYDDGGNLVILNQDRT